MTVERSRSRWRRRATPIPPQWVRFIFGRKVLYDDKTLGECGYTTGGAWHARVARRRGPGGGAAAQAAGGSACKLLQPLLPAHAQVAGAQLGRAAERERHGMRVRARARADEHVCAHAT